MRNNLFILLFSVFLLFACKKDDPVITAHSGLTRIDYKVADPFEESSIEFTFNETYNLSEHTMLSFEMLASEESGRLNLTILLEDEAGHQTDVNAMKLPEEEISFSGQTQAYSFNINEHLGSVTASDGEIRADRISGIVIRINSGIDGRVSEGSFWIDKITFSKPQSD